MDEVTFIIKTFERTYCLLRLVRSIFKYYPDAKVIIGDDSRKTCKSIIEKRYPGITVYELPYDCGLSYGRNYLVDKVETEYFVLLDDDFVFDKKTDIRRGVEILKKEKLDILGGYFRNYPVYSSLPEFLFLSLPRFMIRILLERGNRYNYIGEIKDFGNTVRIHYYTNLFPAYKRVDICHNFFIARTSVVRDICRWEDEIKLHEHTLFFINAKRKNVKVGFTNEMSVKHKPIRNALYSKYRNRNFKDEGLRKYGIKVLITSMNGGEETVREIKG